MIKIEKHRVYESHDYRFINFVDLDLEQKKRILEWRNHPKVKSMMVNKDPITLTNHLRFIDSLNEKSDCYYWLVLDKEDEEIGVLDLLHVDFAKDEAEMGLYINPEKAGIGFEFMIECNYFVYFHLRLGNNRVTVNSKNKEILLFNKYIGAEYEGVEIIGDDKFYVNKHSNGKYIIQHYNEFNLLDYAKFVKRNKNV